jgi:uncharacterized protein involved in outer membrane biogenesis
MASSPQLKSRVEEGASRFLQRPLTIEELTFHRWPKWILVGKNVRLWEDASKERVMLEVPSVEAHLSLLSFYRLAVAVSDLKLIQPRLYWRREPGHRSNVVQLIDDVKSRPKGTARKWGRLLFDRVSVKDGSVDRNGTPWPLLLQGRSTPLSKTASVNGVFESSSTRIGFKSKLDFTPRFTATVQIEEARHRDTSIQPVQLVVKREESGIYKMDHTEFALFGGTVAAEGTYDPSTSTDAIRVEWKTRGLNAKDFFQMAGSSVEVSGLLNSEGHLISGAGAAFLPTLKGEINVHLKDGWFGKATGLLKVLTRLNLTTLVTEVKGDHQSRVPFEETRGTIKIHNGIATVDEPFVLQNKTIQMAFIGKYDLPKDHVEGQVAVHFLMVTDEIINKIPIVREILLGDKKGLTPIWLSVKGNPSDPDVRILSGKSIMSPVWNTIENIFGLPKRLIDKITD